jgi:hypothetical protein
MNPLVLLGLFAVAALAAKRRAPVPTGNGAPPPNGNGAPTGNGAPPAQPGRWQLPPLDPSWEPFFSAPGAPRGGTFYPITAADLDVSRHPLEGLASLALFGNRTTVSGQVRAYAQCFNSVGWNRWYYGLDSQAPWAVEGLSADGAFEADNFDAMLALRERRWPARAEALAPGEFGPPAPTPGATKFGLPWLPPFKLHPIGLFMEVVCPDPAEWPEGGSTLDPPPQILAALGVRPPWETEVV